MKLSYHAARIMKMVLAVGFMLLIACAFFRYQAIAQTATSLIVVAANSFLSTLDESKRHRVMFAFDNNEQRARWSNLPPRYAPRGGISLAELNPRQREAAMTLVASALSKPGFEKVQQIMQCETVLQKTRGKEICNKEFYYISILGIPSEKQPWMLQFSGHHLALNITIAGEQGILTPTLTGAHPTLYTLNGKTVRPLGKENDLAFDLLNSLDKKQRKQAILNYRVDDLVLGPGEDGRTIQPEGLKVASMDEHQRAILLDLIGEWAKIIHESAAQAKMQEIKAGLDDTWFAWSGPTTHEPEHNGGAYYRIQGPNVIIEFAPQNEDGDRTVHVHTMYRDPTNDYGRKLWTK